MSEYITRFDEFAMRCSVSEPEMVTLSRFRAGLNDEIKRELFLKEVHDLEHAYQIALDSERFQRKPVTYRTEPTRYNPSRVIPNQNQVPSSRPRPNTQPGLREDRGKAPVAQREKDPKSICFRCNQPGHFAAQCPLRALYIGDPELEEPAAKEPSDEEVYEAATEIMDEYVEDEEVLGMDQLGVVRCILTQAKQDEDWRRTNILQTFIRIGEKVCKVIIDSGSCCWEWCPKSNRLGCRHWITRM